MIVPAQRSLRCCLNSPVNKTRIVSKLGNGEVCPTPAKSTAPGSAIISWRLIVLCNTGTWFAGRAGREGGSVASEYGLICLKHWNIVLLLEIIASSQPFESTAPVSASSTVTIAGLGTDGTDIYFFQGNNSLAEPREYGCCLPAWGAQPQDWSGLCQPPSHGPSLAANPRKEPVWDAVVEATLNAVGKMLWGLWRMDPNFQRC